MYALSNVVALGVAPRSRVSWSGGSWYGCVCVGGGGGVMSWVGWTMDAWVD